MEITPAERSAAGPARTGSGAGRGKRETSAPYSRAHRLGNSKADSDGTWKHDLFPDNSLSARLSDTTSDRPPKVNASGAISALRKAVGDGGQLSIRGASSNTTANIVEVSGLVRGTTAADVEAIFKRCGPVIKSNLHSSQDADNVVVRITFKNAEDARTAVSKFHGQAADGRTLSVFVIGSANASLGGRLGALGADGSVDELMVSSDTEGGSRSKMRSDDLLNDPRAQVVTSIPGDPPSRGSGRGRGGRGGRRGRGRRGAPGAKMDLD